MVTAPDRSSVPHLNEVACCLLEQSYFNRMQALFDLAVESREWATFTFELPMSDRAAGQRVECRDMRYTTFIYSDHALEALIADDAIATAESLSSGSDWIPRSMLKR